MTPSSIARALPIAAEATVELTTASIRIGRTSEARLISLLGQPVTAVTGRIDLEHLTDDQRHDLRRARRIGGIVTRVARTLPWKPTCLRQSLATRAMLTRRGIDATIHLGIADVATMDAHAWVTVDGWTVVGRLPRTFTAVASFPPRSPGVGHPA
ncbi:MAG: lasso peptide biosynthesis B2 protein [Ilumatobacteraceae bacterium]